MAEVDVDARHRAAADAQAAQAAQHERQLHQQLQARCITPVSCCLSTQAGAEDFEAFAAGSFHHRTYRHMLRLWSGCTVLSGGGAADCGAGWGAQAARSGGPCQIRRWVNG